MGGTWNTWLMCCFFGLCVIVRVSGVNARQVCSGASGRHGALGADVVHPGYLAPAAASQAPSRLRCSVLPRKKVADGRYIKDINYFNQFPRFVEGTYSFKRVDINPGLGEHIEGGQHSLLFLLGAIGSVRKLCLLPNGNLRVVTHVKEQEKGNNGLPYNLESITTFTLGFLHQMYHRDAATEEWFNELKERDYEPPALGDLVDTSEIPDVSHYRQELENGFNRMFQENFPGISLEPIGWRYIPNRLLVEVIVRVLPLGKVIMWAFNLPPGEKPIQIDRVTIKALSEEGQGVSTKRWYKIGLCHFHPEPSGELKMSRPRDVGTKGGTRMLRSAAAISDHSDSDVGTIDESSLHCERATLIHLSGDMRTMCNKLYRVLKILDENLMVTQKHRVLDPRSLTGHGDVFPRSFWLQKLSIILNGKFHSHLPLLVLYVQETGTYHLCSRDVNLLPREGQRLWNPWVKGYFMRNLELIPPMYRGVMFSESRHFEITEDHIQQLLVLYKPFSHLDVAGHFSGVADPEKQPVKRVIHIGKGQKYMVNIVT